MSHFNHELLAAPPWRHFPSKPLRSSHLKNGSGRRGRIIQYFTQKVKTWEKSKKWKQLVSSLETSGLNYWTVYRLVETGFTSTCYGTKMLLLFYLWYLKYIVLIRDFKCRTFTFNGTFLHECTGTYLKGSEIPPLSVRLFILTLVMIKHL